VQEATGSGAASATLQLAYARAGRYIIRATATAFDGAVATSDLEVLVYKQGDVTFSAKCCRNTASVVAGAPRPACTCT
jgi:hypothetical protein